MGVKKVPEPKPHLLAIRRVKKGASTPTMGLRQILLRDPEFMAEISRLGILTLQLLWNFGADAIVTRVVKRIDRGH